MDYLQTSSEPTAEVYSVVLDAVLLGHTDRVYSVAWQPAQPGSSARPSARPRARHGL